MKNRGLLLLFILVIITQNVFSQFKVGLQMRPRTEFRKGFKKLVQEDDKFALFTEQRSRLKIGYKHASIELKLEVQDIRIWGETGQINKSDGLTSVHQAYAIYYVSPESVFKIGRQELVYDDHRILGSLGWAAQARSHDAVRYMYNDTASGFTLHAGLTWNQDNMTPEPAKLQGPGTNGQGNYYHSGYHRDVIFALNQPKTMQYLWLNKSFDNGHVSLLALNTGWQQGVPDSAASVEMMQTIGVNPSFNVTPDLKVFGSFYYQMGNRQKGVAKNAMLASMDFQYTGIQNYRVTLGGDYLSGDDPETNDEDESFNPLFGTHHKFYGFMDYFYVGNPHNNLGLLDIYLKNTISLGDKATLIAHLHNFSFPIEVTDAENDEMSSNAGTEIDLVGAFTLKQGVMLKLGYSQMFATKTMEVVKGGQRDMLNNWGWVMIDFNPVIFVSSKK